MNYCSKLINNIFCRTYNLRGEISYGNMNYYIFVSTPLSYPLLLRRIFTRWTGRFLMWAELWLRSGFYLQSWMNVINLSFSCSDLSAGKSPSNSQLRKCRCKMIYKSSSFLNIAADDVVNDSHFRWRIKFSHLEARLPSCLYILKKLLHWKHFICMANESYFRHRIKFSLVEGRASFFNVSRRALTLHLTCMFMVKKILCY